VPVLTRRIIALRCPGVRYPDPNIPISNLQFPFYVYRSSSPPRGRPAKAGTTNGRSPGKCLSQGFSRSFSSPPTEPDPPYRADADFVSTSKASAGGRGLLRNKEQRTPIRWSSCEANGIRARALPIAPHDRASQNPHFKEKLRQGTPPAWKNSLRRKSSVRADRAGSALPGGMPAPSAHFRLSIGFHEPPLIIPPWVLTESVLLLRFRSSYFAVSYQPQRSTLTR
jgi:hypothetical protein